MYTVVSTSLSDADDRQKSSAEGHHWPIHLSLSGLLKACMQPEVWRQERPFAISLLVSAYGTIGQLSSGVTPCGELFRAFLSLLYLVTQAAACSWA